MFTYLGIMTTVVVTSIAVIVVVVLLGRSSKRRMHKGRVDTFSTQTPVDATPAWNVPPPSSLHPVQSPPPPPLHPSQSPPSPAQLPLLPPQSVEKLIGRNVIGIMAAVLVLIGIALLGFLFIPSLEDGLKIALMFGLSLALTAVGILLTRKTKNVFTSALLGTGCGAVFISIMIAHTYFQAITDIAAFTLLLVWMAGSLGLTKMSESTLMSVIVHVGMVFSICFAYATGMAHDRVVVLLAYHVLSVALITVGNLICCKKAYRFGLFASLALSFVAVFTMLFYYRSAPFATDAGLLGSALAAFAVQAIGASIISALLFASTSRIADSTSRLIAHSANKVMLIGTYYIAAFLFPGLVMARMRSSFGEAFLASGYGALIVATAVSLFLIIVHSIMTVIIGKRYSSDKRLVAISVIGLCGYGSLLVVGCFFFGGMFYSAWLHVPGLTAIALVLIACSRISGNRLYSRAALSVLSADALFMVFGGYASVVEHGTVVAGFIYLAAILSLITMEWMHVDETPKWQLSVPLRITLLVVCEVSTVSILAATDVSAAVTMLAITVILVLMVALKFDIGTRYSRPFWLFCRINELVVSLVSAWMITQAAWLNVDRAPYAALSATTFILLALCLARLAKAEKDFHWMTVLAGVCLTVTAAGSVVGLSPWTGMPYLVSLAAMVTALACVIGGIVARIKCLRLYGLILVICCVLKLVTIDVIAAGSLMRTVAFIAGGITCFIISGLYSYAVKRLDEGDEEAAQPQ